MQFINKQFPDLNEHGSLAGAENDKRWHAAVCLTDRETIDSPPEVAEALHKQRHAAIYSQELEELQSEKSLNGVSKEVKMSVVKGLLEKIQNGDIHEFLSGQTTYALPASSLTKASMAGLILLALIFTIWDARLISLAQVADTQSFWGGFASGIVVVTFMPVAEVALLHWIFSHRALKAIYGVQGALGIALGLGYLCLNFTAADDHSIAALNPHPGSFDVKSTKLLLQLTCSMLLSGACLGRALAFGECIRKVNPEYAAIQEKISRLREEIAPFEFRISQIDGRLRKIGDLLECAILASANKAAQIKAANLDRSQKVDEALSQSFKIAVAIVVLCAVGCGRSPKRESPPDSPKRIAIVISSAVTNRAALVMKLLDWTIKRPGNIVRFYEERGEELSAFAVPTNLTYFTATAVLQRIAPDLRNVVAWTTNGAANASVAKEGDLHIPTLLERIHQGFPSPDQLILIGPVPPLHQSDLEPAGNRAQTDAARSAGGPPLNAPIGRELSLKGCKVGWLYWNGQLADLGQEEERQLADYYAVLFENRAGKLISFTPDIDAGLRSLAAGIESEFRRAPTGAVGNVNLLADGTKERIEESAPLKAEPALVASTSDIAISENSVPASLQPASKILLQELILSTPVLPTNTQAPGESATIKAEPAVVPSTSNIAINENSVPASIQPPSAILLREPILLTPALQTNTTAHSAADLANDFIPTVSSGVALAIRYKGDVAAADIYLRVFDGAEEISFKQSHTALGNYYYRFDQVSGTHCKWITVPTGCDPSKTSLFLNYSKGFGRLAGTVLWITPDATVEVPFSFVAIKSGHSDYRKDGNRRKSPCWYQVNLTDFTAASKGISSSSVRPEGPRLETRGGHDHVSTKPLK